jgi:FkbM family methyltransferase
MKPLLIGFDKNECKIYITYYGDIDIKGSLVVSDLYLDCVYHTWDVILTKNFDAWIVPLHTSLVNVVLKNPTFAGFNVKLYNEDKRLLQVEKVYLNKVDPIINKPLYYPDYDTTGPSYVDFFYGDLCDNIDMSGTIVDAGANVGFFTLFAKEKGARKIYSIEPDPLPYYYLHKNFSSDPSITLVNKAMGATSDMVLFNMYLKASVGSTLNKYSDPQEKYSIFVESITVPILLLIEPEINLLKLDIEGAEVEVIEQLTDFSKINQLFIEFHDYPKTIADKLIAKGYQVEYRHSDENSTAGFIYAKK